MSILSDIWSEVKSQSKAFSSKRELQKNNWVLLPEGDQLPEKTVLIFKTGGELLVSKSGVISKERWEFLNDNTISISDIKHLQWGTTVPRVRLAV
ncbi:MAG: hypothetical protein ACI8QD_001363 [Cyclobacteriaceae bacterium]|jgi:hypothetical protein